MQENIKHFQYDRIFDTALSRSFTGSSKALPNSHHCSLSPEPLPVFFGPSKTQMSLLLPLFRFQLSESSSYCTPTVCPPRPPSPAFLFSFPSRGLKPRSQPLDIGEGRWSSRAMETAVTSVQLETSLMPSFHSLSFYALVSRCALFQVCLYLFQCAIGIFDKRCTF